MRDIVVKNTRVLGPVHHCARRHDGGDVACHKAAAGHIGNAHHRGEDFLARFIIIRRGLGEHDGFFFFVGEII